MATTFNVIFLGTAADMDPTEGNAVSENASSLVGNSYGSIGDSLVNYIQSLSPGSTGFAAGMSSAYDTDNTAVNDTFRIDGGADHTMDSIAVYDATLTYVDGSTATISALVFQDTAGNLYLAPEMTANSDQTALEAMPIRSLSLDSLIDNDGVLGADRQVGNFAICFTSGTAIRTPAGDRLIDDLQVGDLVTTMDNGPQPIRWIGRKHLDRTALSAAPNLRPVLIRQGLLGVRRDLLVSPQHGMLLGRDNLVRAKHLANVPKSRIRVAHGKRQVTYIHLMFDAHQIVFVEGVPSESFYPGPMAQKMIEPEPMRELANLFPSVINRTANSASISCAYGEPARSFLPRRTLAAEYRAWSAPPRSRKLVQRSPLLL